MTGLYLHIPFCEKKCYYCNFVITPKTGPTKESHFLDLLEREASVRSADFQGVRFETVYLGGGTPSSLSAKDLSRVFRTITNHFRTQPGAEITCEVNPGDMPPAKAATLKEHGVNRISFGAQSFHDKTLTSLNRSHGSRQIYETYTLLRKTGFKNINLDLILSLPGEGSEELMHSLRELKRLDPEHASLYELTVEPKTVFGRRHERGKLDLPSEALQLEMLKTAREFLKSAGYEHYELLNFAKKGFRSRHNLLYWKNSDYLGLGPGAFSYFKGKRFQYASGFEEYVRKVSGGDWIPFEEETLTADKQRIESFLLALRLLEGAEKRRFSKTINELDREIHDLKKKGLLCETPQRIALSAKGQFFAETVFAELSSP